MARAIPETMTRTPVEVFLHEDIGYGDITTQALIDEGVIAEAEVVAKEECVIAGVRECSEVFESLGLETEIKCDDGYYASAGDVVIVVHGRARSILMAERTALNIICRMSGIATITRRVVEECRKVNPSVRIAATRKTTPGFRYYEKKAVEIGGGDTHRFCLSDCILIKDNHLALLGNNVEEAIHRARSVSFTKKVEVEVQSVEDALRAARAGADIIMLDNMSAEDIKKAYIGIKEINRGIIVEVSGGITPENAPLYAKYCDVISMGCLTHSAKSANLSLEMRKWTG